MLEDHILTDFFYPINCENILKELNNINGNSYHLSLEVKFVPFCFTISLEYESVTKSTGLKPLLLFCRLLDKGIVVYWLTVSSVPPRTRGLATGIDFVSPYFPILNLQQSISTISPTPSCNKPEKHKINIRNSAAKTAADSLDQFLTQLYTD